jgi:hypothetical protein
MVFDIIKFIIYGAIIIGYNICVLIGSIICYIFCGQKAFIDYKKKYLYEILCLFEVDLDEMIQFLKDKPKKDKNDS